MLNAYFQDDTLSSTTIDLYLSMESISPEAEDFFPSLLFDPNIAYNYSSEYLNLILTPTNQIWYYLKGRYAKHTEGLIDDSQPFSIHANSVMECMTRIDKRLKGKDFSRITLADVSSKFHSEYLPKMIELTQLNEEPLPASIKSLMKALILIFIFGVCIPLIIQCLFLTAKWNVALTLCCVLITINLFINFIFNFYNIIREEIYPEIN